MKYVIYFLMLALSTWLAVVWCCKSPRSDGKSGVQDCYATMTVDGKFPSKLLTDSTSAVNRVGARPTQTSKVEETVQSVQQSLPLSAESAICEFAERQTNSSVDAA